MVTISDLEQCRWDLCEIVGTRLAVLVPGCPPTRVCNVCSALDTVPVARAPDGAERPAGVCVVMAVGAAGRWHDHPSSLGEYEVADEVVRELIARLGHCHVVPRTPDSGRGVPINGSDVAGRSGSCGRTSDVGKSLSRGRSSLVRLDIFTGV